MPVCNICTFEKHIKEFHRRSDRKGHQYTCKDCKSLNARKGKPRKKSAPLNFHHSLPGENWKPIKNYEKDYQISNKGRVRSTRNGYDKLLKGAITLYGYRQVGLYDQNGMKMHLVHILVANHFLGLRPTGYQVNHKDFDRQNNEAINLEYATPMENIQHNVKANRHNKDGGHKLLPEDVRSIRKDPRAGILVAQDFKVNVETVYRIRSRKSYKNLL